MGKPSRRQYISLCGLTLTSGCAAPGTSPSLAETTVEQTDISPIVLPYEDWPLTPDRQYSQNEVSDLPDLRMYKGEPGDIHPLLTARQLNRVAHSIQDSVTSVFDDTIHRLTDAFVETATEIGGSLFFPYTFDFNIHGNENEHLSDPWYSGMAQGEILGTFSRLRHLTGAQRFAELAEKTFQSLAQAQSPSTDSPWVTTIDKKGYYWIEEYPTEPPAQTLNGKIFAIYGLYEYWLISGRDDVKETIQKALATILIYIDQFRNPGDVSYYCLKHDIKDEGYHHRHVVQLEQLYQMTGDRRFKEKSEQFRADFWKGEW
ncbi:D-glucuronyl C5-epimerase family protein [Natrinema sp. LN54]|uniref:D-glucuronyl C5-epimerase family protein n=1 Tax=Natrinema sp. LN54 TaxID=3458705 RepID=UPI0040357608